MATFDPKDLREGGHCPPVHLDDSTFPEAFIVARSKAWAAGERVRALRRSGAPAEEIEATDNEYMRLAEEALSTLDDDYEQAEAARQQALLATALAKPFEDKIKLVVHTLRRYGPMTATNMAGRGLKGLSNNYVRPVLQEAQRRGLVDRERVGRQVLWTIKP